MLSKIAAKKPEVKIEIIVDAEVVADESISSVFENIISNAFTHGKTDRVVIEIEKHGDFVITKIRDFGVGIPDEIKEKIFEEGFAYGDKGHTGMGLYIAKKLVGFFGGDVWVEDNEPKGACFVIKLRAS